MGYPTCMCPIRRHGCYSFMGICAALYNLLIHKLVRKHPASSHAQTNLRCGSLLVVVRTVTPQAAEQAAHSVRCRGCSHWLRQRCDAGGATSGNVKPGFDGCCFHSRVSASCYKFLCFFYTTFKINLFFISKVSLKFPDYCLILLIEIFLLNVIRFWQTHTHCLTSYSY